MTKTEINTEARKAKKYIKTHFEFCSIIYSFSHELTDNGHLTVEHLPRLSKKELINVANDIHYNFWCSFGHMLSGSYLPKFQTIS